MKQVDQVNLKNLAPPERPSENLLVVAYHYPPHLTPHALRWYYLSEELARLGYSVDLVTAGMPARFYDQHFPRGCRVTVHSTFPGPFFNLTYRLSKEQIVEDADGRAAAPSRLWNRLQKLHAGALRIMNTLLLPDAYGEWLPFALIRTRSLLKSRRYLALITTSEPRVGHLVGWLLKRSASLPWIADYGDPWVYPVDHSSQPRWKKRLLLKIEHRILQDVDALTLTTRGHCALYRKRFPCLNDRPLRVIAQGYDARLMASICPTEHCTFRLIYCGSLYPDLRDPRAIFQAVRDLPASDFELLIAGRINEFAEMVRDPSLSGKVRHTGFVHHRTALALEKGATMLLHIANASEVQVPGKIYEYLGTARPILVVTDNPDDEAARLVVNLKRGLVTENRPSCIKRALAWLYHEWRRGRLDGHFDLQVVRDYSWQNRAVGLHELLQELHSS